MKRKILSSILTIGMITSLLAGCGSTAGDAAPAAETEETAVEETAAETPAGDIPTDYKYYFGFEEDSDSVHVAMIQDGAFVANPDKDNVYLPGVKGQALYADGTAGHMLDVNGVGEKYTLAFWTYNARVGQQHQPVVQYGPDIYGNKGMDRELWVNFTYEPWNAADDSQVVFPCVWSHDSDYITGAYNEEVTDLSRQWIHVAMTVDPSVTDDSGFILANVYLNGELMQGKDLNGDNIVCRLAPDTMTANDGFEFLLGQNYWDSIFKGAFDEIYIYDYVLDAGQVKALYQDGNASAAFEEPERIIEVTADANAIESLGSLDLKAAFGSSYSTPISIADGETYKIKLHNWGGTDTKDNYALVFGSEEKKDDVGILYADASGTGAFENADYTYTWGNWQTWSSVSMVDVTSTISVTRDGDTIKVEASNLDFNNSSQDMTATAKTSLKADDPLSLSLSCQNSYVDILSVKDATLRDNAGIMVGASDLSTPFWTEFSPVWAVPEGASRTIGFTNYTDGAENWDNFLVVLQNTESGHSADTTEGYAEYAVLRADNYGWGAGYDNVVTPESDWNWDTFKSDVDGAHVEVTVTNNGDTADVTAVARTTDGTEYHQYYNGVATGGDLYFCFTCEKSYLQFDSTIVGATDLSSPFWSEFSDIWAVPEGKTKSVSFTNYTDGAENWDNFVAILQNTPGGHSADAAEGYAEYAVVRADNYGWGAGYDGIVTPESDWNWDTFKSDIDGAAIDLTVTNNGDTADVHIVATTAGGTVYHQDYKGIETGGDLYLCLGLEKSYLVINGATTGATDNSTGWWTQHSSVKPVAKGETEYASLTNYTSGGENWHNYVVVLQNTPSGHSADTTEGYAEYAVVRADNFGWGAGYDGIVTPECDWNWDTFKTDMDGAHSLIAITNNGDTADIVITTTTAAGAVYNQSYKGIKTGGDLYYCLSCEAAHLTTD